MEKQPQQYVWWGIGAVVLIVVAWMVFGHAPNDAPAPGGDVVPAVSTPRRAATGLVGEIVAGAILPISGDQAVLGKTLQNAITLAVEDINAERGVTGKKLVFAFEDGACNKTTAEVAAQRLATDKKVQAIIGGGCADETAGATRIADASNVLILVPGAAADATANATVHVFRLTPPHAVGGSAAAAYATGGLQAKRSIVLSADTAVTNEWATAFTEAFKKKGGALIGEQPFAGISAAGDVGDLPKGEAQQRADTVFLSVGNVVQLRAAIQQVKAQIPTASIIAVSENFSTKELMDAADVLADVTIIAPFYDYQAERMQQFIALYKARHGEEPAYPLYAANAYSHTYLLRDLIEKDGYEAAKMQKTLRAPLTGWSGGAFGKVDLNTRGDTIARSFALWKIEGGSLVSKGVVEGQ